MGKNSGKFWGIFLLKSGFAFIISDVGNPVFSVLKIAKIRCFFFFNLSINRIPNIDQIAFVTFKKKPQALSRVSG